MEKENSYAFIDSQNLNLGINSLGWKLDFGKFRLYLRNKYNVQKAFLFIGFIPENADLYKRLQEQGYILIFKNVLAIKKGKNTIVKGNVDAELVLHTMIHFGNYDKAIIVSGDGDFYCLVEYLSNEKKLGKVMVPNQHYSSLLRKFAQYITPLNNHKRILEYKDKNLKIKKERHSRGKQG